MNESLKQAALEFEKMGLELFSIDLYSCYVLYMRFLRVCQVHRTISRCAL